MAVSGMVAADKDPFVLSIALSPEKEAAFWQSARKTKSNNLPKT